MQNPIYDYQTTVERSLSQMREQKVIRRMFDLDHTVWKPEPDEITNRLGWLDIVDRMRPMVEDMHTFVDDVRRDGIKEVVLCGMGGSSLAPEMYSEIFGASANRRLKLRILDTTSPDAIRAIHDSVSLRRTLFIIASKSGGTVETISLFKYFFNHMIKKNDLMDSGQHFVAITDPGSKLVDIGQRYNFRRVFLADENVGGRYSALTHFGLVPAALAGLDVDLLLERAAEMVSFCNPLVPPRRNPGALLGTIIAAAAQEGRDKLTLITPPSMKHFGYWVEQLVAESIGKQGKGILPVVDEPMGAPFVYGNDRLFVYYQLPDDNSMDDTVYSLELAGHPVIRLDLRDIYDLGGEIFRWELATATIGHLMGIQPFDQPNVESAKVQARAMVQQYTDTGRLPEQTPAFSDNGIIGFGDVVGDTVGTALWDFLEQSEAGDYVALQAYLPSSAETTARLQSLQTAIRDNTKFATTVGYGPRFLHSTGQLHKGDDGNGLFIIITGDPANDLDIPRSPMVEESDMSFGVLLQSQALGDQQALLDENRRVLRLHLGSDVEAGLAKLHNALTGKR